MIFGGLGGKYVKGGSGHLTRLKGRMEREEGVVRDELFKVDVLEGQEAAVSQCIVQYDIQYISK